MLRQISYLDKKLLKKDIIWELDFSPRPILDKRGKKSWELLITDDTGTFVFSDLFPNTKINSVSLKSALVTLLENHKFKNPTCCRFFRGQVTTIISRALLDLNIKPIPSRRCYTLVNLLNERSKFLYKQHPGYSKTIKSVNTFNLLPPQELKDELRGEKWMFVQLPALDLQKVADMVEKGEIFGSSFLLSGLSKTIKPKSLIPGVAVFSQRATPLAAWTGSLELATIKVDIQRACLILETGVDKSWLYGSYRKNKASEQEAKAWENAKKIVDGLHFLVIQPEAESTIISGLWFMNDKEMPKI